jgi:hypothetical protein
VAKRAGQGAESVENKVFFGDVEAELVVTQIAPATVSLAQRLLLFQCSRHGQGEMGGEQVLFSSGQYF